MFYLMLCLRRLITVEARLMRAHKETNGLLEMSKKSLIKLSLIGHSLGAAAATIDGIAFNSQSKIDAAVIGFGTWLSCLAFKGTK